MVRSRGISQICIFHQGRFEDPRGMLVPRAEDTANEDEDGLAIFEGPGAVGAFV
jgi:hypothetical protein